MGIYIKASEAVSCQDTFNKPELFAEGIAVPESRYRNCLLPDFKQYIDVRLLRRMSKVLRMGVATAKSCLDQAGLEQPDAIVVGTGLGCLDDTTKFLDLLIGNDEKMLNPTPFIQSTHNTIAGQIALMIRCKGYNLTFTQKNLSFETALMDACMVLKDGEAGHVLVGGVDELNDETAELMDLSGCIRTGDTTFYSEGATFFVLSASKEPGAIEVADMEIINRAKDEEALQSRLQHFLGRNSLTLEDIDVLVSGENGSSVFDGHYRSMEQRMENSHVVRYKHLTGEHQSASAFGMFLANNVLRNNAVPEPVLVRTGKSGDLKTALVFNYTKNEDFSFVLLSKN
ncbi:MAG: beta-ketoacyl synthase chain length factor [Breznakibacter sp.]